LDQTSRAAPAMPSGWKMTVATNARAATRRYVSPDAPKRRRSTALAAHGLGVRFGSIDVLDDVNVQVRRGQIVGLIGANGAGKTTFIDAVGGFVPYAGRVELAGAPIDGLPAFRRARGGLARTWQTLEFFRDLSVRENIEMAQSPGSTTDALRDHAHTTPPHRACQDAPLPLSVGHNRRRMGPAGTAAADPGLPDAARLATVMWLLLSARSAVLRHAVLAPTHARLRSASARRT
jgi:ABC-type transport system involved in cytochrome bd biosynthesis fused ATPase/permease subunit